VIVFEDNNMILPEAINRRKNDNTIAKRKRKKDKQ